MLLCNWQVVLNTFKFQGTSLWNTQPKNIRQCLNDFFRHELCKWNGPVGFVDHVCFAQVFDKYVFCLLFIVCLCFYMISMQN